MLAPKIRSSISALVLSVTSVVAIGISCTQELLAQEKFKVGAALPLTGVIAEVGIAARNGIELAKEQHPELFTNLEFVYEDSQWDPKSAVAAFNKLVQIDKVSLVFNWGNPTSEAVAPLAEARKIPLLALSLDPSCARGRNYAIRFTNPSADFSKRLARYIKAKGYKKLGVVLAQNTYVQGLLDGLKENLADDQHVTTIATFNLSDMDFRSAVLKVKSGSFDALGVFLISGQVSTFYRQLKQQQVNTPTFGTDFFESPVEIKSAGGAMEGAVYPHLGISPQFEAQYKEKYKNDYQIAYAGNAYDLAVMLGTLFNAAPTGLSSEQILATLKSNKSSLTGVTGSAKYQHSSDGDSYFEFPIQLKRVENGGFLPMSE
jgi:ABC-type branched-subunit amino acid transport system substrate-binding protein